MEWADLRWVVGLEVSGISIPYGISGGAIAILVSLAVFFAISLGSPPPQLVTPS